MEASANNLLRVTLAQIDIVWENPSQNRENLNRSIPLLKDKTDLIILPETFTTGFTMNVRNLAELIEGPTVQLMRQLAAETGAAICGSLIIAEEGKYFNRFVFVKPDGILSFYNKRHLFSIGGEDKYYHFGYEKVIINYLGWRIAPYICYDLRFPVWLRSHNEVDLMIFSANWPEGRRDVWNILLKARAIENQVYVAGVNRVGSDGNNISYKGESTLLDPRGRELIASVTTPDFFSTEVISLTELNDFRQKFPVVLDADPFELL
jgi:omega-amidase